MWYGNYAVLVQRTSDNAAVFKAGFVLSLTGAASNAQYAEPTTGIIFDESTSPGPGIITSETKALSIASSWNRKFQSLGIDCRALVFLKPEGTDEAGTSNPLPTAAQGQQLIAQLDTPERDLLHAMRLANKGSGSGGRGGATYGSDYEEDVAAPQVVNAT